MLNGNHFCFVRKNSIINDLLKLLRHHSANAINSCRIDVRILPDTLESMFDSIAEPFTETGPATVVPEFGAVNVVECVLFDIKESMHAAVVL